MIKNKLYIILILALLLRSYGLDLIAVDDEASLLFGIKELEMGKYPFFVPWPVHIYFLYFYTSVINFLSPDTSLRLLSMFFGLLTIIFVYHFAKKIYDEKTAIISTIIIAISFYHVLASLQIDKDGSMVTALLTLTFFSYYLSRDSIQITSIFITGILFGMSLLLVPSTGIVIPILLTFDFLYSRLKNFKAIIAIGTIGLFIYSLLPITLYATEKPEIFINTLMWGERNITPSGNFFIFYFKSVIKHIVFLVEYSTPLLVILPIWAYTKKERREEYLLFLWIAGTAAFFIFITPTGAITRYQMPLIPPLSILSARALSNMNVSRKDIPTILVSTIFFYTIFAFLGDHSTPIPISMEYLNLGLLWQNPDLWFMSFRIPVLSFLATILFSLLLFLIYRSSNKKNVFLIFIGLNLAYNTLLAEEFLFFTRSPNYDDVVIEMIQFYEQNNFKKPVYAVHETIPYYMDLKWSEFLMVQNKSEREKLMDSGGIVMWLNLPPATYGYIARTLDEVKTSCNSLRVFRKNDIDAGYVFLC